MTPTLLERLAQALADHDEWPTKQTGEAVINAARNLVNEERVRQHYIRMMAETLPNLEL